MTSAGVAKATRVDHFTPFEPRFSAEVGHAAAGMRRHEANRIVCALLDRYEARLADPPGGTTYAASWDVDRKEPGAAYLEFYHGMRSEMRERGIPLTYHSGAVPPFSIATRSPSR